MEMRSGTFSNILALQLTDFNAEATPGGNQEAFAPLSAVWYTAPLSSNNLGFINKSGVTQFRLRYALDDNDDRSADHLKLFSGEAADANRPRLVITYFVP
jgi:hypothetical protein